MEEMLPPPSPEEQRDRLQGERMSRRMLMMKIGIAVNAIVAVAIATPVVAFLLGPVTRRKEYRHWTLIGNTADFHPGETRLVKFRNPFTNPWDGETANVPAYVRCVSPTQFAVFAINCAHLNCPVRWFSESQLFMCPCHGGIYYADGSRASGPPERGLFTYDVKLEDNKLLIDAGQMPTLSNKAEATPCPKPAERPAAAPPLVTRITPCPGTNEPTIG